MSDSGIHAEAQKNDMERACDLSNGEMKKVIDARIEEFRNLGKRDERAISRKCVFAY